VEQPFQVEVDSSRFPFFAGVRQQGRDPAEPGAFIDEEANAFGEAPHCEMPSGVGQPGSAWQPDSTADAGEVRQPVPTVHPPLRGGRRAGRDGATPLAGTGRRGRLRRLSTRSSSMLAKLLTQISFSPFAM